jgi:hypothetical protein
VIFADFLTALGSEAQASNENACEHGRRKDVPKLDFIPSQHGFHFPNSFTNRVVSILGHDVTTKGRCGGMAYAALDYRYRGNPIPRYYQANFAPQSVPPDGHWLADYIYKRLMDSFHADSADKFVTWTLASDHETTLGGKGVTRWTKEEELPKLRGRINSRNYAILGLIKATSLTNIGDNHQVVAYGYDDDAASRRSTVYVYDNRYPDREMTLSSTPDNPHFNASNGEIWRGFFLQDYRLESPPVYTYTPPPTGTISYGSTIKLSHVWSGSTLHSHGWNYEHPGTSGQQQVTAWDWHDDNDWFRVKGPHGQPENYRVGEPVQNGHIIRLEHVQTRKHLHSHSGFPSPVTHQQEVTCFGNAGIGDGNDNWRVELEVSPWDVNRRLKLIHVPTNYALHSHRGYSHPTWTRGQQEVTCFGSRDANDWWLLLEKR